MGDAQVAVMSNSGSVNQCICVTEAEGIISDDVDKSIRNLTSIGREAMCETDRLVLNIMTNK